MEEVHQRAGLLLPRNYRNRQKKPLEKRDAGNLRGKRELNRFSPILWNEVKFADHRALFRSEIGAVVVEIMRKLALAVRFYARALSSGRTRGSDTEVVYRLAYSLKFSEVMRQASIKAFKSR